MKTRAILVACLSAAALAAQSGVVFELDPELVRFLELTPSQVAAILNNDREFNATAGPRREQRLALEAALAVEEAMLSPNPARLGELEAELERIRRDGLARRNGALNRNRGILTPAQRERLQPGFADPVSTSNCGKKPSVPDWCPGRATALCLTVYPPGGGP